MCANSDNQLVNFQKVDDILKCGICAGHRGWKIPPCREGGKKTAKWSRMTAHAIHHILTPQHDKEVDRKLKVTKQKQTLNKEVSNNLVFLAYQQILSGGSYR